MPILHPYVISSTERLQSYTCGSVWRTCTCTPTDQAQRLQRLRDQAIARDAAERTEAEEQAAAILAVEEAERREAEEVARQEWLRVEAEAERVAREAQCAIREAEMWQRREEERLTAITLRFGELRTMLEQLHITQQKSLTKRHDLQVRMIEENLTASQFTFDAKWKFEATRITQANNDIIEALAIDCQTALEELSAPHEQEDDDRDLRPCLQEQCTIDTRKTAIAGKDDQAWFAERQEPHSQLTLVMNHTRRRPAMERGELQAALMMSRQRERLGEAASAELVARKVFAQRMWFDWLVCQRRRMLEEDERRLIKGGLWVEGYGYSAPGAGMVELS